ncbi:MFS transporter [Acetobacter musti]|uniref:MFS transporter n=1 Tax=Acetobacter musti TaxID=864732 RepID=A0ABX0JSG5_9PROT|nr:MFS transporter [Acetobacter musti]NHN84978.1 MFS transporter [Acetobacter musti]
MTAQAQFAGRSPYDFSFQYLGLLLFMIGDGVEVGYLSPFLVKSGLTEHFVALVFTVYGLAAAVSAWGSGVLCDRFGCRKVILSGILLWVVPQILFLAVAVPSHSAWQILLTYGVRGFGYPLLAYGILTLLVREVRREQRGLASGLFWFCFTCGLPTLGTVVAGASLPVFGEYGTFWVAFLAVILGGGLSLVLLREEAPGSADGHVSLPAPRDLLGVIRDNPSLVLTCVVRAINSSATHGIIVFMPFYFMTTLGLSNAQWLRFLETIFASNIVCNVFFGALSDRFSWRATIMWVGGVGSGLACLLLYWVPARFGHVSPAALYGAAAFFGLTLAGYVPLSALAPSLLPERKGLAMSFLNFGAGCSVWLGPLIVYVFQPFIGVAGVLSVYALLFVISGVLVHFIRLPQEVAPSPVRDLPSFAFSPAQR